jgi:hypothetical protein
VLRWLAEVGSDNDQPGGQQMLGLSEGVHLFLRSRPFPHRDMPELDRAARLSLLYSTTFQWRIVHLPMFRQAQPLALALSRKASLALTAIFPRPLIQWRGPMLRHADTLTSLGVAPSVIQVSTFAIS